MAKVIFVSICELRNNRRKEFSQALYNRREKSSPKSRSEHSPPAKKPRVVRAMNTKPYPEFNFRHKFSLLVVDPKNVFCPTNYGKKSYRVRGEKKYSHSLVLQSMARLVSFFCFRTCKFNTDIS